MGNFNENLGREPTERGDPIIVDGSPAYVGEKEKQDKSEDYDIFNPPDDRPYP